MRAIVLAAVVLCSCAEEEEPEPNITYDCSCDVTCDGAQATFSGTECRKRSEIQAVVSDAVRQCVADMTTPPDPCGHAECACECRARDPELECTAE